MDYRPPTDIYLLLAFWTGVGAFGLTLVVGLQIVWLRLSMRRQQRREQLLTLKWRPLLNASIAGETIGNLPDLAPRDNLLFIKLWLHLQQAVRGEASEGLNAIARRLGCDRMVRTLLVRGNRAERLLAMKSEDQRIETTQQALAADLATAREVIGRALKSFEASGWVKITRGGVEILDRRALTALRDAPRD